MEKNLFSSVKDWMFNLFSLLFVNLFRGSALRDLSQQQIELFAQADELERRNEHDLAERLREQARGLSLDNPLGNVPRGVAILRAKPSELYVLPTNHHHDQEPPVAIEQAKQQDGVNDEKIDSDQDRRPTRKTVVKGNKTSKK